MSTSVYLVTGRLRRGQRQEHNSHKDQGKQGGRIVGRKLFSSHFQRWEILASCQVLGAPIA